MITYKNYTEDWKPFATFIKQTIEERKIKPSPFAEKIGINKTTMIRFLNHEYCLNFKTVLKILAELEIKISANNRFKKPIKK